MEDMRKCLQIKISPSMATFKSFQRKDTICGQEHVFLAVMQRQSMHQAIFDLKPNQGVIIADFKENFHMEYNRDQESQEFFHQNPVTCLSFVTHIMTSESKHIKTVFTILSKCLSHNAQFVIRALKRVLREPEFIGLTHLHWWSDGAGHFKNLALLQVLQETNEGQRLLSNCDIEVSIFCAAYGKSECDSCFGYFSRLLKQCITIEGIKSLNDLVSFFQDETSSIQGSSSKSDTYY
ncbi:MAG: hypothetical protein EZS28_049458, partial [Streblomastix strix]